MTTKDLAFALLAFAGGAWLGQVLAQPTGTQGISQFKMPLSTVATLPTCNTANEGLLYGATDQATAVAYNGAVTGSGSTHQKVYCNGTAWVQQ
jgi:hypothetical protein